MNKTKIECFDSTWNPVTGCLHNCEYCYARSIARRFDGHSDDHIKDWSQIKELHDLSTQPMRYQNDGKLVKAPYPFGFDPTFHRYRLDEPARKKKPQNIFVCSMSDLFGDWIPDEWIQEVFKACEAAPQHRYLFLTKNPARYGELPATSAKFADNFWFGWSQTTPNSPDMHFGCHALQKHFVSIEPIHTSFAGCDFSVVDWVIVGAETGNRKDKIVPKREWIENIVEECRDANTPVFMKNSLADIWGEPLIQEFPW